MKKKYYINFIIILIISSNILTIYKNYILKKNLEKYKEEVFVNRDNTIKVSKMIDANIYRCALEKQLNNSLDYFEGLPIKNKTRTVLFIFDQSDCEMCVEKVIKDLLETNNNVIFGGDFVSEKTFSLIKNRYKLDKEFHNIDFYRNSSINLDNHKPFIALIENNKIVTIFIIDKYFDNSYYYFISEILQ